MHQTEETHLAPRLPQRCRPTVTDWGTLFLLPNTKSGVHSPLLSLNCTSHCQSHSRSNRHPLYRTVLQVFTMVRHSPQAEKKTSTIRYKDSFKGLHWLQQLKLQAAHRWHLCLCGPLPFLRYLSGGAAQHVSKNIYFKYKSFILLLHVKNSWGLGPFSASDIPQVLQPKTISEVSWMRGRTFFIGIRLGCEI